MSSICTLNENRPQRRGIQSVDTVDTLWDEAGVWLPCSSKGGLGRGAAPSSGIACGDSSFLNNEAWENGKRGTPTSSGCFCAVILTISRISPWRSLSCRVPIGDRLPYSIIANLRTLISPQTVDSRSLSLISIKYLQS